MENSVLKKVISQNNNFILACGGGTPCFKNNMELMNNSGISILIEMPATAICSRLSDSKSVRPLLSNYKDEKLLQKIEELLQERQHLYNQAHIIVNGLNYNVETILQQIESQ